MPMQPRSRMGILSRPFDMYCILAIWLTISPTASSTKSANMKSMTGRRAGHGGTAGQADEAALADGSVAQAFGAVQVVEPGGGRKLPPRLPMPSPSTKMAGCGPSLRQGFERRLHEGDLRGRRRRWRRRNCTLLARHIRASRPCAGSGQGAVLGELLGRGDHGVRSRRRSVQSALVAIALDQQDRSERWIGQRSSIPRLPPGAIGEIAHALGVRPGAIGFALEQGRAFAGAGG